MAPMSLSRAVFAILRAPWGPVHVAATADGIVGLDLMAPTDGFVAAVERRVHGEVVRLAAGLDDAAVALLDRFVDRFDGYLTGRATAFDLPVVLPGVASWDRAVLEGVRGIGWGDVTSYGGVARRIGRPGAARAVGGAVGRNPIGLLIPCHRVIAGDGSLGGYGGSWFGTREALLALKRQLLELEGIELPARDRLR